MEWLLKIKNVVDRFIWYFTGGVLLIMALIVTYTVISRLTGHNVAWIEEIVRAGVVWTTFLGAYAAITQGKDIKVGMFLDGLPKPVQEALGIIAELCVIVFLLVFIPQSFNYTIKFASYKLPMTGMSRGLLYSVFPFGGCMMLLHSILTLIQRIAGLFKSSKKAIKSEGERI